MLKRLPLLIALGLGSLGLAWGLFVLQGIFLTERDDALVTIASRHDALEQYAAKELEQRLHARLEEARPTIEKAVRDPLVGARGFWLWEGGEQVLPRTTPYASYSTDADALAARLKTAPTPPLLEGEDEDEVVDPWRQRRHLTGLLRDALDAKDRAAVERVVRGILAHRASFVIASRKDVPATVAMLELLSERAEPQRSLMEGLLRKGLGKSRRIEGLQRLLLARRKRFARGDFRALAERIVRLSERHHVIHSDFQERVQEDPAAVLPLPHDVAGPVLGLNDAWYVEPRGGGRAIGVRVKVAALLDEITLDMRARRLLGAKDELRKEAAARWAPTARMKVAVASPRFQPAIDAVHDRYRLKAALLVAMAAVTLAAAALGLIIYRRRHRFLELKSTFVSAVSHELRTPLASIRLMAETLERRTKENPKVRDYPTRIIRDIDGLSFLVENILSFDRLQRGRWVPKKQTMNLGEIAAKVEADIDLWRRARPAELSLEGLDDQALEADPDLLQLVLTNLCRNACQYCKREPAEIAIRAKEGDPLVIEVEDNGVGIPEEEWSTVFDDFYRAKDRSGRAERGSGLGLAICTMVVEAHGGTIRVARSSPEGTTFELTFPRGARA